MIPDFINLTDRRTKATVFINVEAITSIVDLRTAPSCLEDFHFTVVRCGNDEHEVKETIREICNKLTDIRFRYARL